ncbi:hypothetical protein ACPZ19_48655 [Amycolatopsis lurida]
MRGDVFPGGLPDRHPLDTLVPDRPAVFSSHDAHGVWVNSRALAGIDRDSRALTRSSTSTSCADSCTRG